MWVRNLCFCVLSSVWMTGIAPAIDAGQIGPGRVQGRIVGQRGAGIEGATVLIVGTTSTALTGPYGEFVFERVPPGVYALTVTFGVNAVTIPQITVASDATSTIEEHVDWAAGFTESLTVMAGSRRREPIVETPASVSRLTAEEIAARAAHSQLAKLVEFVPGAQLTQGGLYDYNLNVRGFNSTLNRRVAVLIDGRNPAAAFFGAQEWAAIGFPLDDLNSVELVRGPSAALYGANASSGVLTLITREPKFSKGGQARVTFGELGTAGLDFRWAGGLGREWYVKATGGMRRSGDFFASRKGGAEYSVPCRPGVATDCLPQEAVPRKVDDNQVLFGGFRADRYFASGMLLTMEGGVADLSGPTVQTGVGRTQITDSRRPWARVNLNGSLGNVFVAYTGRDAPGQLALSSGTNSTLLSDSVQAEGQVNRRFNQDRLRLVLGASAVVERIDSFDEGLGRQSLLFEPLESHAEAVFGQVEWQPKPRWTLVFASRGDFSTLHDFQFSPKGSVLCKVAQGHQVRLTYSEAFQVPSASELFLQADAAAPANLGALNAFCVPFGVDCGFGPTRILALGNSNLETEQIRSLEAGYKGLIARRGLLTVDYYRSRASNFTTDLLRQLDASLGRINPNFGPWQAPAGIPESVAAQIRADAPASLSNNLDGSNILAAASYTNFGRVDTQGIDVGLDYTLARGWRGALSYSWFDFTIRNPVPGLEAMVLPNAPEHAFSIGAGYARPRFDANLSLRWVDSFRWSVGVFQGNVESYATAELVANYRLTRSLSLGLNVGDVFDDRHWESFGGDVLRRRVLGSLQVLW